MKDRKSLAIGFDAEQKLRAYASQLGLDVDTLAEQIIVDALPSADHEDLIGTTPSAEALP